MKRLFAAIKITPGEAFLSVYYRLIGQLDDETIKWVEPHNLHITLKFFGETHESKIPDINKVLHEVSQLHKPFQISIRDVGIFGSRYHPRVIWFGIENGEALQHLAGDLFQQLETAGFAGDRQNFVPHLTVGRIRKLQHKPSFQRIIDQVRNVFIQTSKVNEIILFESILKPAGPEYKIIERHRLGK